MQKGSYLDDGNHTSLKNELVKDPALVYMRYLGNYDIEKGEQWKESMSCWICDGWQKVKIDHLRDD